MAEQNEVDQARLSSVAARIACPHSNRNRRKMRQAVEHGSNFSKRNGNPQIKGFHGFELSLIPSSDTLSAIPYSMASPDRSPWSPQLIRRVADIKPTGTEVVEVVTNDGPGFVKFLGNREGPHVLACEFIGTRLAGAMGLPTLDWHVLDYDGIPEIVLPSGNRTLKGPAWSTRKVEGFPWSGDASDLAVLENPSDLAKLVLLDQWTLNCDRYRPVPNFRRNLGNVFFTREGAEGKMRLLAIDHTHIFTCGAELRPNAFRIDRMRDTTAFGLFPEFSRIITRPHAVAAVEALRGVADQEIRTIVQEVPMAWEVVPELREALIDFLKERRNWLLPRFITSLFPQDELF